MVGLTTGVGQSLHEEKGKDGEGHSALENWKEQDVPGKDQDTPGWDLDSWLEGGPSAILRQSLPIAFRATGVFSDGVTQTER